MSTDKNEATLVIIKPDGIKKSLTGNIISRLSETKLQIIAAKMTTISRERAEEHYSHLTEKPFFEELVKYMMGAYHTRRVMAMVYYGPNAISKIRTICGATNPEEAEPTTIRGSYGRITTRGVFENVIHASESAKDAEKEIKLWFGPDEIAEVKLYPSKETTVKTKVHIWA
jgi:nucleoside-diphosphate kinase